MMSQTINIVKVSEIRKLGTEALVNALGPIGMARYIEGYDNGGNGDYTKEKYEQHDYVKKLYLYLDAGVREYWIVNPQTRQIHVYNLEADNFTLSSYTFTDTIKAGIYDDLYIDFSSLDIA